MTDGVRFVEEDVQVEAVPLASGQCQATKVILRLKELGFWKRLRTNVYLRRRAGSYEALDLILFLVAYFSGGSRKGFKRFAKETEGEPGRGLAALVGRMRWMIQSGVSRALSAVCDACLQEFVELMREIWPKALELQKLSKLGYRDAFDRLWQVIHYDGSVVPVRQRQLPKGGNLPKPRRSSRSIAAGGYPGRKRAEAVVQRAFAQDGHFTWWVACDVEPGNGDAAAMALVGAGEAATHTAAGSRNVRAVFVADGGGGGWAPLRAAIETGLYGLVRCSLYHWLDIREVRKKLYEPGWHVVPDSRSGPSRSAKELGIWRDASGHLFRVVVSRFAAKEATTARGGAGREIRGWHYELFLTDLPADAWPAHDVVRLYYDRCGQENRFAMLNQRYNLKRLLCYHKQGHALATLVALLVWNVEVLMGAEALGPWDEKHPDLRPKPRNDTPVPPPEPEEEQADTGQRAPDSDEHSSDPEATDQCSSDDIEMPPPEPKKKQADTEQRPPNSDEHNSDPEATDQCSSDDIEMPPPEAKAKQADTEQRAPSSDEHRPEPDATDQCSSDDIETKQSALETQQPSENVTIEQALAQKREDWLSKHPGWTEEASTLVCPAGTLMTSSLLYSNDTSIVMRFRASSSACRGCTFRDDCSPSAKSPNFRKDFQLVARADRVANEDIAALNLYRQDTSRPSITKMPLNKTMGILQCAVSTVQPGPYSCRMSRLSVGELLHLHDESARSVKYAIDVQVPKRDTVALPPAIAPTAAQRQRRRKTFAERIAWNDLPSGSTVRLLTIQRKPPSSGTAQAGQAKAA